jgi:ribosomal protein S11
MGLRITPAIWRRKAGLRRLERFHVHVRVTNAGINRQTTVTELARVEARVGRVNRAFKLKNASIKP